ncbi:MAG: PASTA domain-containing protein [Oscillospiraceae bacterium]
MVDRICDNCMNRVPANADKCPKCGIRFENTNPGGALPNGWVLAQRYTVGRYIDIDGEGVTYSAIDGNSFQRVIIKEYMPVTLCAARDERGAIVPKPGCEVLFKTTRMDFSELYTALVGMNRAEGLVGVLDAFEENNTAYAVLEKVEGPTLAEYLVRNDAPVETNRALAMLRPVMLGVEALHAAGVVHRGISPENIVLESGGTAKLGGYATLALRQQGSELKPKLYAGFSAPEQYSASEFEGRFTDVYAIAAVLYRMVTGQAPVPADERRVQDTLRPARTLDKEIPAFLSTGIARAMRVNPDERIQTIGDLRMAFSGEGPRASAAAKGSSSSSFDGLFGLTKQQTIIAGTAVGAVLLLLVIVLSIALSNRGGGAVSSSVSEAVSSSQSEAGGLRIPDYTGKRYDDVIKDKEYVFAEAQEEYSDTVELGRVISQLPIAGTEWDGETPIQLVVSKGVEPIAMPDFVSSGTVTQAEAELTLTQAKVTYTIISIQNDGSQKPGAVVKTDPAAGAEVIPGTTKVTLYIAAEASTVSMRDVTGQKQADAVNTLKGMGIDESRITIQLVDNDGKHAGGTVASTNPVSGTAIAPGSVTVTLSVYRAYLMQDISGYVGRSQAELTSWLDERKANFSYTVVAAENDGSHTAGTISQVDFPPVNSEVSPGTVITIHVYGQAVTP